MQDRLAHNYRVYLLNRQKCQAHMKWTFGLGVDMHIIDDTKDYVVYVPVIVSMVDYQTIYMLSEFHNIICPPHWLITCGTLIIYFHTTIHIYKILPKDFLSQDNNYWLE